MHPIAFQLGPFPIHWYGVMVGLGFMAGLWTAGRRAPLAGLATEKVIDLGPWLIIGTLLGARSLYVISYWRESFADRPLGEIFAIWNGGLVFYGGLIGATFAGVLYARLKRLRLWNLADVVAPSIALGYVFGRVGCLLNGCCYGRPCHLPWAITFPPGAFGAPAGVPLHPTEIYESVLNVGLYAGLAWLFRHRKFHGQVFGVYLVCYSLLRSFVELFRGDYPQHYLGGWATPAHLVSMVILLAGLALLWFAPRPIPGAKMNMESRG
jgi:phosphatidylglycerol---prolipoprotein diacylglyceryl transferase